MAKRLIELYRELLRRRVIRAAAGYIVVLWILSLGAADLFPAFGIGNWAVRGFIFAGLLGLPLAVFVSWKYNLTTHGLVKDPMDIEDPPPTSTKIREWCEQRRGKSRPSTLIAYWTDDKRLPRSQRFTSTIVLGRELENEIGIADPRVSRIHAVIWYELGGWRIRDLDSSNGTFLSGKRLQGNVALPPSGELHFHEKGPTVRFEIVKGDETMLTLKSYSQGDGTP